MKKLLLLPVMFCSILVFAQKPENFQTSHLSFIPNKGQYVTDQDKPAEMVHFKADVHGLEFYITDNGISYVFLKHNRDEFDPALGGHPNPEFIPSTDFSRVDMNLIGAQINRNAVTTEFPTFICAV